MKKLAKRALKGCKAARKKIDSKFGHSEYRFLRYLASYMPNECIDESTNDNYFKFSRDIDCTVEYFSYTQYLARKRYNNMSYFLTEVFTSNFVNIPEIKEGETILFNEELVKELYNRFCHIVIEQFEFLDKRQIELLKLKFGFNFDEFIPNDICNITEIARIFKIPRYRAVSIYCNIIVILRNSPKLKLFEEFLKFKYNGDYLYKMIKANPELKCSELFNQLSFKKGLIKEEFGSIIYNYEEFFKVPISFLTVGDVVRASGVADYKEDNSHISIEKFFEKVGEFQNVYRYFSTKIYRIIFQYLFNVGILYINESYTDFCIKDMSIKSERLSLLLENEHINHISEILDRRDFFLDPYNSKNSMIGYLELISILKDAGIICLAQHYNA